jgi:hypothetical protein
MTAQRIEDLNLNDEQLPTAGWNSYDELPEPTYQDWMWDWVCDPSIPPSTVTRH